MIRILLGLLAVAGLAGLFIAIRPKSFFHSTPLHAWGQRETAITLAVMLVLILLCTLPMSVNPLWNGEVPGHRNQYEKMAESLLHGHLYLEEEVDPRLLEMANPYDPDARDDLGVSYLWDHAFYDGQYYMYFGVVPVFLVFLPYRMITGVALTTYKATQLFVALAIVGLFYLLRLLAKAHFKNLPFGTYLFLATAVSAAGVFYSIAEPALYCTAITSAICLEVWSLCFFVKAVWLEPSENKQIVYAFFGSLCGALTFGCRPTIALANLLVVPMLLIYVRRKTWSFAFVGKLAIAALPYVAVGALLMTYNALRFDSPFEFGQSYQLTVADQSAYATDGSTQSLATLINGLWENLFAFNGIQSTFPYYHMGGAFANFPLLLLGGLTFKLSVQRSLKERKLRLFMAALLLLPLLITVLSILWTPYLLERYRLDIYFLLGILAFMAVGLALTTVADTRTQTKLSYGVTLLSIVTVAQAALYTVQIMH